MKTLHIDVFNPSLIYTASPFCGGQVFAKGFEKNGHEVYRFDYRASQIPNKELITFAETIKPDLLFFGKCERITPETVGLLRSKYPNAIFVKWLADCRNEPTDFDLNHLKYMDLLVATHAGEYLAKHKKVMPSGSKAMSIFTFTDSDFYKHYDYPTEFESDVLWTGRRGFGDNEMRNVIIDKIKELAKRSDMRVKTYGVDGENWLGYPEYLYAICGTKIGIGSNSFNRRKYSSDRLGNYMACGTFYFPQYIEGIEECFTRFKNLDWFETIDEMVYGIEYYLECPEEREEIAKKGQKFVLKHFDTKPLVKNILNVLETGKSLYKWDEII